MRPCVADGFGVHHVTHEEDPGEFWGTLCFTFTYRIAGTTILRGIAPTCLACIGVMDRAELERERYARYQRQIAYQQGRLNAIASKTR